MDYELLPSPIRRVFYLSSEGSGQEHEVFPQVDGGGQGEGGGGRVFHLLSSEGSRQEHEVFPQVGVGGRRREAGTGRQQAHGVVSKGGVRHGPSAHYSFNLGHSTCFP